MSRHLADRSSSNNIRRQRLNKTRRSDRRRMMLEQLERREMLVSDFTNPFVPLDVSNDGVVSAIDALQVINDLNSTGPRELTTPTEPVEFSIDTNGDCNVSAIDVLVVINALNDDNVAPTPAVALQTDTGPGGVLNDDLVTSDGRLAGTITDLTGIQSLEVSINGAAMTEVTVERDGSFTLDASATDGAKSLSFVARDGVGNKSTSAFSFTLDTTAPSLANFGVDAASDTGVSNSDGITMLTDVTLSGDVETGATVTLSENGTVVDTQVATSPVAFALSGLADGTRTFQAIAEDLAGNVSATVDVSVTVDTAAPALTVDAPTTNGTVDRSSRLMGTLIDDAESQLLTYQIGDGPSNPVGVTASGKIDRQLNLFGVTAGAQSIQISASDRAGNAASASIDVIVDTSFDPLALASVEPTDGEDAVGVMVNPRITFNQPIDRTTLTSASFFAMSAGNVLDTTIVPSTNNDFAWIFPTGGLPASSRVTVTVNGDLITTASGEKLDADDDGTPGGTATFSFTTGSTTPVTGTSLTGIVFDPGPDRQPETSDDLPLAGVEVFLLGRESDIRTTDSEGRFTFDAVPTGNVKIAINGLPAPAPDGIFFPEMVMDANMLPGQVNFTMVGMEEVFLPRIDSVILNTVDATTGATIVATEEGARELPAEQRARLVLEVAPNSFVGADGALMDTVDIGISTVPAELVADMLPPGVLQHTFDITIQAPGVTNLATPAPLTFPNVFDADPGTQLNFLSFDHTTGRLVIEGTATVSADGLTVTTDPGTGVTRPGWHGLTRQGSNTKGGNGKNKGSGSNGDDDEENEEDKEKPPVTIAGRSQLFTSAGAGGTISVAVGGNDRDHASADVSVTLNGVRDFLSNFTKDSYNFKLKPGQSNTVQLTAREQTDAETMRLDEDELVEGEIPTGTVTIKVTSKGMVVEEKTLYYGRLFTDADGVNFPTTLAEVLTEGDEPEPQDIRVVMKGPGAGGMAALQGGNNLINLVKNGGNINLQLQRDPGFAQLPNAQVNIQDPDGNDFGGFTLFTDDPLELDPLAVRVIDGEIKGSVKDEDFSIQGKIQIGLSQGSFTPLVEFDGKFEVNKQVIKANGKVTTDLLENIPGFGAGTTLFSGGFEIARGVAQTENVRGGDGKKNEKPSKLAGLDVELKSISFEAGKLVFKGKFVLPDSLGNVTIDIGSGENDNNQIEISSEGINVTGGLIDFPDVSFKLFKADVEATQLQLEYRQRELAGEFGGQEFGDRLLLRGNLNLDLGRFGLINARFAPTPEGTEAMEAEIMEVADALDTAWSFAVGADKENPPETSEEDKADSYIQIEHTPFDSSSFALDAVGRISLDRPVTFGPFTVESAFLDIDTMKDTFLGFADVKTPIRTAGGFVNINALLGVNKGNVDIVALSADNLAIPIGATGGVLQKVGGGLKNLNDPPQIELFAAVAVTAGPQVNVSLPSFLGGGFSGSALRIDVGGSVNKDRLRAEGQVVLVGNEDGGLLVGNGMAEVNWTEGHFKASGAISGLGGALTFDGSLQADSGGNFSGFGTASAQIPEGTPFLDTQVIETFFGDIDVGLGLGGTSLGSASGAINFSNDSNFSNDFVAFWGRLPIVGTKGLKVHFDGNVDLIGASEAARIQQQTGSGEGEGDAPADTFESDMFDIPVGTPSLLLIAGFANPSTTAELVIDAPDGTRFTEADIATNPDIEIITDSTNDRRRAVRINSPDAGAWSIHVVDATTDLGDVVFSGLLETPAPTIEITSPTVDVVAQTPVEIGFTAADPDSDASIMLFVDTDRVGFDGIQIADNISDPDGASTFSFDPSTANLPAGEYFVYGMMIDEQNVPAMSNYSLGKIIIVDQNAPAAVEDVAAKWLGNGQVQLDWSEVAAADSYLIRLTDDAGGAAYQQDVSTTSNQTTFVVADANLATSLTAGETYRLEVFAVDVDGRVGASGGQAIAILGDADTTALDAGEFDVFANPGTTYTGQVVLEAGDTATLLSGPSGSSVNSSTGEFTYPVPGDASGFENVRISITKADGTVLLAEHVLFSTSDFTGDIIGQKHEDANRDGVKDTSENGIDGVTIELVDAITGAVLQTTTTDSVDLDTNGSIDTSTEAGIFQFTNLPPGNFLVREVVDQTRPALFATDPASQVAMTMPGATTTLNFGNLAAGTIQGTIFEDTDFDGTGDSGVANVTVFIDTNDNDAFDAGTDLTTTTLADDPDTTEVNEAGHYEFTGLGIGTFEVGIVPPVDFVQSSPADSALQSIAVAADETVADVDFLVTTSLDEGAAALTVLDPTTTDNFFGTIDLGTVVADGAGGDTNTFTLDLINFGGQELTISSISLAEIAAGFSISGATAGDTLLPDFLDLNDTLSLTITFDPAVVGTANTTLTIESNDPASPRVISLTGVGQNPNPELVVTVDNNNAGGVVADGTTTNVTGFATLTNVGAQELSITGITGDTRFMPTGIATPPSQATPLVLQTGETFTFDLDVMATNTGLLRGFVTIESDDPTTPSFQQRVVATGIPPAGSDPADGNHFVAVETPNVPNAPIFRTITSENGEYEFFLPAESVFQVVKFDPASQLVAHVEAVTSQSGQDTDVPTPGFVASTAPDIDGDGVPGDVEFAIGSSDNNPDSNGDGIDDFQALAAGLNPLGDAVAITGILGAADVTGSAVEVEVGSALLDPSQILAFVATGTTGVSIIDISDAEMPVVISELALAGDNQDLIYIPTEGLLAVAGGSAGLHIVDVIDPTAPVLEETLDIGGDANRIASLGLAPLVTSGSELKQVDILSGEVTRSLVIGSDPINDLLIAGDAAFVTQGARNRPGDVTAIDIGGATFVELDSISIGRGADQLAVDGNVLLIASRNLGGFSTVDISDPSDLTRLGGQENDQRINSTSIVVPTPQLVIVGGDARDQASTPEVQLYTTANSANTTAFITKVVTADDALGLAQAGQISIAALGNGGVEIINFLAPDADGLAPTVSISSDDDADPGTAGIQAIVGSTISVQATASDDVQIARVELLVNGARVASDLNAPFDFSIIVPSSTTNELSLTARAIDTGGNEATSSAITLDVASVTDTEAPRIASSSLAAGDIIRAGADFNFELRFSEPLTIDSFTTSNFSFKNDQDFVIRPTQLTPRRGGRRVLLTFPGVASGDYTFAINASGLTDRAGNALGATPIETTFEAITADAVFVNANGGDYNDPANWQGGTLPSGNDTVLLPFANVDILLPTNDTISFSQLINRSNLVARGLTTLDGDLLNAPTGVFEVRGDDGVSNADASITVEGDITNRGTIELEALPRFPGDGTGDDATLIVTQGSLTNEAVGTIKTLASTISGSVNARRIQGNVTNIGTIEIGRGLIFNQSGTTLTNQGTITGISGDLDVIGATLVQDGGTMTGRTDLTSSATLMLDTDLTLPSGAELFVRDSSQINGTGSLLIASGGQLDLRDGTIGVPVTNQGGFLARTTTAVANAEITNDTGGLLQIHGDDAFSDTFFTVNADITNRGTIELDALPRFPGDGTGDDATLVIVGNTLTNETDGTIRSLSSTISGSANARRIRGEVNNQGSIEIDQTLNFDDPGKMLTHSGTLQINSGEINFLNTTLRQSGGTLLGPGDIDLADTATLTLDTDLTVPDSQTLFVRNTSQLDGSGTLTIAFGGNVDLRDGTIGVPVTNQGVLLARSTTAVANAAITIDTSGLLQVHGDDAISDTVFTVNADITNRGTIDLQGIPRFNGDGTGDDATLVISGATLTNEANGTIRALPPIINGSSNARRIRGNVDNQGTIEVDQTLTFDDSGKTFTHSGLLQIDSGQFNVINTTFDQDSGTLSGPGSLDLEDNGTLTLSSDLTVPNTVTLFIRNDSQLEGTGALTIASGGKVDLRDATVGVTVTNQGTFLVRSKTAVANAAITNDTFGLLQVHGDDAIDDTIFTVNAAITNRGTIELQGIPRFNGDGSGDDATLAIVGATLTNEADGTIKTLPPVINGSSNLRRILGDVNNQGTIEVDQTLTFDESGTTLTNSGTLQIDSGEINIINVTLKQDSGMLSGPGDLDLQQSGTLTLDTDLTIPSTVTLFVRNNSLVNGTGSLNIASGGMLDLRDGTVSSSINSVGNILARTDSAVINGAVVNDEGGVLEVRGDNTFNDATLTANAAVTNRGLIELEATPGFSGDGSGDDANLVVSGATLTNEATGLIKSLPSSSASGSVNARRLRGNVNNQGTIEVDQTLSFDATDSTLTNSGTLQIDVGDLDIVDATLLQNSGTLAGSGRLDLSDSATLTLDSDLTVPATASVALRGSSSVDGTGTLTIAGTGTVDLRDGTIGTAVTNNGKLLARSNSAVANGAITIEATGELEVRADNTFVDAVFTINADLTNRGTIKLTAIPGFTGDGSGDDATLIVEGATLVNESGASIMSLASSPSGNTNLRTITATVDNRGHVVATQALRLDKPAAAHVNSGTIEGGTVTISGAGTAFSTSGTISIPTTGTFTTPSFTQTAGVTTVNGSLVSAADISLASGTIAGGGTVTANITNSGGIVAPGANADTLTITGDYTQQSGGTLGIEIGGAATGEFDVLSIGGTAALDGTLALSLIDSFDPALAQSFEVITATSVSGTFSSVTGSMTLFGLVMNDTYNASNVTIDVAQPLRLAGQANGGASITLSDVDLLKQTAISLWVDAGISRQSASLLRDIEFQVVDLQDDLLGLAYRNTILLDIDAAGAGWFVDSTPSTSDDLADDAIDLLTVIAHELGHALGLDDNLDPLAEDIMAARLAAAHRRTPARTDVDAIMAELAD